MLPWNGRERLIIGSITRYHRKSLPQLKHDNYAALNPGDRKTVAILASFLRLADGLDSSHQNLVSEIKCRVAEKEMTIVCTADAGQPPPEEMTVAQEKSDLLQKIYKKKIEITWSLT
jgi:exopolyphosphatase/guanosine-5'-triphosphate,3'-diphosphate pyrophosphatase